jgi:hypothetical protein
VALGIEIINEMDSRFEVERVDLLEKLLASLEKRPQLPPPQREVLVDEALAGAHEALKEDRVAVADSLAVLATRSASKGMDLEKKRYALALREHVAAVKSAWEAMQTGLDKLKSSPDNPAAHLAVGRYLAFARGDFKKGCEHLAKGSDAAIAEAAKQQLAVEGDLDELAAADAWNSLLPSLKSPAERLQLQRHILQVCEELKPRLTGLELGNATQHITRLLPIIAEADKHSVSLRRTSIKPAPGLIVRIFASRISTRTATPFVAVAKDEQDLARIGVTNLLRPYGGRARYLLSGAVVVTNDMQVRLRFEECSVAVLNETQVATSGRPIDQVIMLKKGTYPIRIESTGFGFGFEITNLETSESLLFHPPAELEAELTRPGFDPTGAAVKSQRVN